MLVELNERLANRPDWWPVRSQSHTRGRTRRIVFGAYSNKPSSCARRFRGSQLTKQASGSIRCNWLQMGHLRCKLRIMPQKSPFWKLTQRRFIKGYTQADISRRGEQQSEVPGFAPTVAANVDVSTQNSALTWLGRQEDCISAVRRSLDRRGGRMRIQRRRVFCDDSRSLDVYAPAARSASGR